MAAEKSGDPASSKQKKDSNDDMEKDEAFNEDTLYLGFIFGKINILNTIVSLDPTKKEYILVFPCQN